jgi:WD40 repeat protein
MAVGAVGGVIKLWKWEIGRAIRTISAGDEVYDVAFSPDGCLLASSGYRRGIQFWDPQTGGHQQSIVLQTWSIAIAFSPDGLTLAVGTQDGEILLIDTQTGAQTGRLKSRVPISSLAYAPNPVNLISACIDIRIWRNGTGDIERTLGGHSHIIEALAVSADGCLLASASRDKTARVWDLKTGELLHTLTHRSIAPIPQEWNPEARHWKLPLAAVAFTPDGRVLATGGADRIIYLWDTRTGEPVNRLEGHQKAITDLAFSSDGQHLASASMDGRVRIWPSVCRS